MTWTRPWRRDSAATVPGSTWSWPRRETTIQVAVWTLSAIVCLVFLARRAQAPQLVGLARGRVVQLSVPWAARVEAVPVGLFQRVRRDEVLAILDHSVLTAQIEQTEAEIARLRSEHAENQGLLDAEVGARLADWDAGGRAFARDAAELEIRLHEVEADLRYDRSMLEGLRANVTMLEKSVANGHAAPAELELSRAEAAATASRHAANERLAADLRTRLTEALGRQRKHLEYQPVRPSRATAVDHLTQAIAVQVALQRELEAQREQCILRAPFDGTIVEIRGRAGEESLRRPGEGALRRPGEVVGAGEAVVAVASERPTEVVAYLMHGDGERLRPGLEVELVRAQGGRQVAISRIEAVGPTRERLPESLWGETQVPRWGRPLIVRIPPEFDVVAGDPVDVWFR